MEAVTPTLAPTTEAGLFGTLGSMGHEQVVFCHDPATGLKAIIGIHNTVLGPALGGTRFWNYATEQEALTDVLRLSRGMTFKAAISGLHLGGGKAVIIGDARKIKNEFLMRRFGKFVDSLNGKYITAEDVNIGVRDMEYVNRETDHVVGLPVELGGSGDPSPVTAFGVYQGMKAAAKFQFGSDALAGKKIVVQGVGQVGKFLVDLLIKEGAQVFIYDINTENVDRVVKNHPSVKVIAAEEVFSYPADIFAPCALGAILNEDTIPQLKYAVVAGGANNQLKREREDGQALEARGIVYAPDFLINAGGLINVSCEIEGYNRDRALKKAEGIYDTAYNVLARAREDGVTPQEAAIQIATERIQKVALINQTL